MPLLILGGATLGTIQTRVTNLVGSNVAITLTEINDIIQAEHETILGDNSWSARKAEGIISTIAPYATGTITTSGTTVTGSGTTFTLSMVGRWLRAGSQRQFYKITDFASATSLTIETAQPTGDIVSPTTFSIFQHVYALPSDCERITSMVHMEPVTDLQREELDRIDPDRSQTGAFPRYFCYREPSVAKVRQVEVWPVPSAGSLIRFQYLRSNSLIDTGDSPLYRSDVLVWKAAASAAFLLYSKTGDEAWVNLADRYLTQYEKSLVGARLDDVGRYSPSHKIRDVMYFPTLSGPYFDRDPSSSW